MRLQSASSVLRARLLDMSQQRMAFAVTGLMLAASISAFVARPDEVAAKFEPMVPLEALVPARFGDWREEATVQVVSPEARQWLDKLYGQTLSRVYVDSRGDVIMLAVAEGRDQRGELHAHMPEVCYPASGFKLHRTEPGGISTPFGEIPVRRIFVSRGPREEPVTYWFKFGDKAVSGANADQQFRKRVVQLRYAFSGRIPDGLLFRVSSLHADQSQAYSLHDRFVNDLLQSISPAARQSLTGLGES